MGRSLLLAFNRQRFDDAGAADFEDIGFWSERDVVGRFLLEECGLKAIGLVVHADDGVRTAFKNEADLSHGWGDANGFGFCARNGRLSHQRVGVSADIRSVLAGGTGRRCNRRRRAANRVEDAAAAGAFGFE